MRRYLTTIAALALGAVLTVNARQAPAPSAGGDQPSVTFRVEVNYVEVDAAVFDRQGRFVTGLEKDDFEVLEDGVRQEVSAFSLVSIPIERQETPLLTDARRIEPDVRSNARPFDGRLYVIVLDDLHTTASRTSHVRRAARDFVEQYMADNDMAAVVHTSGMGEGQEFTSSKRLLLAAVDRFTGQKLPSATVTRLEDYQRQQVVPRGDQGGIVELRDDREFERGRNALRTLDALKAITDWVGGIRGRRKAIVFLSEGIDYDVYDFNKRDHSTILDRMRDIIAASARSNVSIYASDPRGLTTMGEESIEVSGGFPQDQMLRLSPQSFQDELRLGQQNLRSLAEDTGGFAAVNTNDFSDAWQRVVADNSQYYVLGYYSSNERRDGRFRKIEVRVPGQTALEIRSRKGYTAPRGKQPAGPSTSGNEQTSPELRQALDSPIPLPGITLRVHGAAFRGEQPKASAVVTVEVDGADLRFATKDGKFVDDLEVSVLAIDAAGKVRGGDRSVLNLGLRPETHERVVASGLRTQTRLELEPGRYQIRVGARETGAGRVGTVNYDLVVPDFSKEKLVLSDVVLTAASTQQIMNAKLDEELKQVLPAAPTSTREFLTGDVMVVFAEVYDNAPRPVHVVDIRTSVLGQDGQALFTTSEERSSEELQGKTGGYGHRATIPLKDVRAGSYVLRVEARSRAAPDRVVTQEVLFRVRQSS